MPANNSSDEPESFDRFLRDHFDQDPSTRDYVMRTPALRDRLWQIYTGSRRSTGDGPLVERLSQLDIGSSSRPIESPSRPYMISGAPPSSRPPQSSIGPLPDSWTTLPRSNSPRSSRPPQSSIGPTRASSPPSRSIYPLSSSPPPSSRPPQSEISSVLPRLSTRNVTSIGVELSEDSDTDEETSSDSESTTPRSQGLSRVLRSSSPHRIQAAFSHLLRRGWSREYAFGQLSAQLQQRGSSREDAQDQVSRALLQFNRSAHPFSASSQGTASGQGASEGYHPIPSLSQRTPAQPKRQIPCFDDHCIGKDPAISVLLRKVKTHHDYHFCQTCCLKFDSKEEYTTHQYGMCTRHCIAVQCATGGYRRQSEEKPQRHVWNPTCPEWQQIPISDRWKYLSYLHNPDGVMKEFVYFYGEDEPHGNGRRRPNRRRKQRVDAPARLISESRDLRAQIANLQSSISQVQSESAHSHQHNDNLREQVTDLQKGSHDLRAQIADLQSSISQAQSRLTHSYQHNDNLRLMLKHSKAQISKEAAALQAQLDTAQGQLCISQQETRVANEALMREQALTRRLKTIIQQCLELERENQPDQVIQKAVLEIAPELLEDFSQFSSQSNFINLPVEMVSGSAELTTGISSSNVIQQGGQNIAHDHPYSDEFFQDAIEFANFLSPPAW